MDTMPRDGFDYPRGTFISLGEFSSRVFSQIFFFFLLLRAASVAYGGSQPRVRIGVIAASLHHSHSNARLEPNL